MANAKKRCKQCREYSAAEKGVSVPAGWFCSLEHAKEFAFGKVSKRRKAEKKRIDSLTKSDVKPIGWFKNKAQAAVNAYVRERDKGLPCISCGRMHEGQWHAGHYLSVGSRPNLRFDADRNIFKQCQPCNVHLSGNLLNFRDGLIKRIGVEAVEALEADHNPKRYRREDYQEIENKYKCLLKSMR